MDELSTKNDYQDLKKINFKFEGKSNPTADELIEVLKSINAIIPKESRENFYINSIEEGSIDIIAFIKPIIDLFTQSNYDALFNTLGKVQILFEGIGASLALRQWILEKSNKAKINMAELEELLTLLNDDPNALGLITHNDFKNFKQLNKVLQKRKSKIIIKGENKEQIFTMSDKDTKIIDLIANASGEVDTPSIETRLFHLNIKRVSFAGKERWRAKILELLDDSVEFISIEDQNLLYLISQNKIYFSGKEVIEAMVRVETTNGKSKYFLTEYKKIDNMANIQYETE